MAAHRTAARREIWRNDLAASIAVQAFERMQVCDSLRAKIIAPLELSDVPRMRALVATHTATIKDLLVRNRKDFRSIQGADPEKRAAAWSNVCRRRSKIAVLIEETPLAEQFRKSVVVKVKAVSERMTSSKEQLSALPADAPRRAELIRDLSRDMVATGHTARSLATSLQRFEEYSRNELEILNALAVCNLPLVVHVAREFTSRSSLDISDLIQEGNKGLLRALAKFDAKHTTRLSTYATWWIRQSIGRAITTQQDTIRKPEYRHRLAQQVQSAAEHVAQSLQSHPTEVDIVNELDNRGVTIVPRKASEDLAAFNCRRYKIVSEILYSGVLSLDLPLSTTHDREGAFALRASISAKDGEVEGTSLDRAHLVASVEKALNKLHRRQAQVLRLRFGIDCKPHSLEEAGKEIGVSKERVRQIEIQAKRKLRNLPDATFLQRLIQEE